VFFRVLLGVPRRDVEEGGALCAFEGICCAPIGWVWGYSSVNGVGVTLRTTVTGEGFRLQYNST
jgi:hypothetical protein